MANFWKSFLELAVEQAGSISKLADDTGITRQTISAWLADRQTPTIPNFKPILKYVGADIVLVGDDTAKSVSFSNMQFSEMDAPASTSYLSVPIVRDLQLLRDDDYFVPASNTVGHSLPLASHHSVKGRPHLVCIFAPDNSMAPLIDPGDVIYVDRADVAVHEHGHLYLVRDAKTDTVCIRRVDEDYEDGDTHLYFTADNPKVRPRHYSVKKHYNGNRKAAILGRVVSARVDMLNL